MSRFMISSLGGYLSSTPGNSRTLPRPRSLPDESASRRIGRAPTRLVGQACSLRPRAALAGILDAETSSDRQGPDTTPRQPERFPDPGVPLAPEPMKDPELAARCRDRDIDPPVRSRALSGR